MIAFPWLTILESTGKSIRVTSLTVFIFWVFYTKRYILKRELSSRKNERCKLLGYPGRTGAAICTFVEAGILTRQRSKIERRGKGHDGPPPPSISSSPVACKFHDQFFPRKARKRSRLSNADSDAARDGAPDIFRKKGIFRRIGISIQRNTQVPLRSLYKGTRG